MGDFNQAVVLDLIRRSTSGLSRAQLARRAGLSAQTISNITGRLLRAGLVTEEGAATRIGPGRPGTLLRINAGSRFAVGVHFDPSVVTCVVIDLVGDVRATVVNESGDHPRPEPTIALIGECVEEAIRLSGVSQDEVLGVGVAAPGPIDLEHGLVVRPPLLRQWTEPVALRDRIHRLTGLPTLLDKDVNAAAFAHLWFAHAEPSRDFVFVYLGTGSAMSAVLNSEVVRGPTGNAGDVGSMLVGHDGRPDATGVVGTLGQLAQVEVIAEEFAAAGLLEVESLESSSLHDVYEAFRYGGRLADFGDARASAIVRRATGHVMKGARDFAHLLEIGKIVIGGPLWEQWPSGALEMAQAYVDAEAAPGSLGAISVASSPWGEEVGAVGGASIVLEQAFAPRPAGLLIGS